RMSSEVRERCGRRAWTMFVEAEETQAPDPGYLLRHLCADSRHWEIDLRYYQDRFAPILTVTWAELLDDRWTIRAWHSDRWLERFARAINAKDITAARPDLWSSLDPAVAVPGAPEPGNANLTQVVSDACLENGLPRRYDSIKRLNDGLRERGRAALLSYLCGP